MSRVFVDFQTYVKVTNGILSGKVFVLQTYPATLFVAHIDANLWLPYVTVMHTDQREQFYRLLGQRIRQLRTERPSGKINQSELAAKTSLTRTSIANIEAARQRVTCHALFDIAQALGVNPAELLPDWESLSSANPKERPEVPAGLGDEARAWISAYISEEG
jgi:transcriptional regulator with XRE-family HTH domain